jgi:hypothetical protein
MKALTTTSNLTLTDAKILNINNNIRSDDNLGKVNAEKSNKSYDDILFKIRPPKTKYRRATIAKNTKTITRTLFNPTPLRTISTGKTTTMETCDIVAIKENNIACFGLIFISDKATKKNNTAKVAL